MPQIVRLVRVIRQSDPSGVVLISHNREAFILERAAFEGLTDVYIVNISNGSRIDFSLPASYLAALDYAQKIGLRFDWVINLTGQCYPVRPLREFVSSLEQSQVDAFIDHRQVFDVQGRGGGIWPYDEAHGRYHYQYYWRLTRREPARVWRKVLGAMRVALHKVQPWVRFDTSYALQIGLRDRSGIIGATFPLFGGSYYMTLSYRAATYLCEFTRSHPNVVLHFSRMNVPSEVYPHTVLANNPDLTLSGKQHFFIDVAHNERGLPCILTMKDLDRIAASGAFFARKFDPAIDSTVLDWLDRRVLGTASGLPTDIQAS
ncbi:core-2/I-branching beta-1,6-N-acetylglucosaminyltransferase family protein [Thermocoleostomius sinensis]|uniref:Uncharacterized protein n=1 Tax=Thermocoleostomius sinensis A174 TaxID=2016057 RepID=A0A9E8ZC71_9CYAN|nr:hypothetical protein [Thermocoleostomius sinensis]WAL60580.1 hypothetical protein OXH18_00875 [Thermocoleostomius sinensis A174]